MEDASIHAHFSVIPDRVLHVPLSSSRGTSSGDDEDDDIMHFQVQVRCADAIGEVWNEGFHHGECLIVSNLISPLSLTV